MWEARLAKEEARALEASESLDDFERRRACYNRTLSSYVKDKMQLWKRTKEAAVTNAKKADAEAAATTLPRQDPTPTSRGNTAQSRRGTVDPGSYPTTACPAVETTNYHLTAYPTVGRRGVCWH